MVKACACFRLRNADSVGGSDEGGLIMKSRVGDRAGGLGRPVAGVETVAALVVLLFAADTAGGLLAAGGVARTVVVTFDEELPFAVDQGLARRAFCMTKERAFLRLCLPPPPAEESEASTKRKLVCVLNGVVDGGSGGGTC